MKSVVITGSTRGLRFEMAKRFRESGWNVLVNGVNAGRLESTVRTLSQLPGTGTVEGFRANVASKEELQALADFAVECFGSIAIWINNAGVNQPMKPLWELTTDEMDAILNTDLRGTVLGSSIAVRQMEKQPSGGFLYNLEGHGSNDVIILGWSMYRFSAPLRIEEMHREISDPSHGCRFSRCKPGTYPSVWTQSFRFASHLFEHLAGLVSYRFEHLSGICPCFLSCNRVGSARKMPWRQVFFAFFEM